MREKFLQVAVTKELFKQIVTEYILLESHLSVSTKKDSPIKSPVYFGYIKSK